MTIATAVPLYVALSIAAILALIAFVWGESRRSTYSDGRYERLVGQIANLRTAVRAHHAATGHVMPDLWDGSPEPRLSGWDRFVRRVVAGGRWVKARFRGPATYRSPDEIYRLAATEERYDLEDVAREFGVDLNEPAPTPGPKTEPIVMPGPATVPDMKQASAVAPLTTFEEWQRDFQARAERDIAAIRGETVTEGER
jgi:hypothetical protein